MRQLTSLDAQFLAIETSTTTGHVGGLAIFDPSTAPGGKVTLDDLLAMLRERLHLLPPLRWRLAEVPLGLDRPYWIEDPDFELEFHVRELALAPPGDEDQLAEQVARISSRHLDRARPLWELYLIHGLPDGHIAVLSKMHHAMIDGMSGAEIMGILFDLEPEGREFPGEAPAQFDGERKPGQLEMLGRGVAGLPLQPLRMLRAAPASCRIWMSRRPSWAYRVPKASAGRCRGCATSQTGPVTVTCWSARRCVPPRRPSTARSPRTAVSASGRCPCPR